jgi:hypothetical protein
LTTFPHGGMESGDGEIHLLYRCSGMWLAICGPHNLIRSEGD